MEFPSLMVLGTCLAVRVSRVTVRSPHEVLESVLGRQGRPQPCGTGQKVGALVAKALVKGLGLSCPHLKQNAVFSLLKPQQTT